MTTAEIRNKLREWSAWSRMDPEVEATIEHLCVVVDNQQAQIERLRRELMEANNDKEGPPWT